MTNVKPLTRPESPLRTPIVIGCRHTPRHRVHFDAQSGVFFEVNPPVDARLQQALMRAGPLRFHDPVPGEWRALRSPRNKDPRCATTST